MAQNTHCSRWRMAQPRVLGSAVVGCFVGTNSVYRELPRMAVLERRRRQWSRRDPCRYCEPSHLYFVIVNRNSVVVKDSPLRVALPSRSVIESINYVDVPTQKQWDDFFSRDAVPSMSGWCLPRLFLAGETTREPSSHCGLFSYQVRPLEQPVACCTASPSDGLISCFMEVKSPNAMSRCLDPFLVLDPSNTSRPPSVPAQIERCESLCRDPEFACMHLRAGEQLLRISHIHFGARHQQREVLVWRGPASEIWDHGAPFAPRKTETAS